MPLQRAFCVPQSLRNAGQLLLHRPPAFLRLRNIAVRFGVLRLQFLKTLRIELHVGLIPFDMTANFHALLLELTDLLFDLRESHANLDDFIFAALHARGARFYLDSQFFRRLLSLADFRQQHVELVARQLRVQVLQLVRELFVTSSLAGLALQRTDLPFDLAHQVLHAN